MKQYIIDGIMIAAPFSTCKFKQPTDEDVIECFLKYGIGEAYDKFAAFFTTSHIYKICNDWIKEMDEFFPVKRHCADPR